MTNIIHRIENASPDDHPNRRSPRSTPVMSNESILAQERAEGYRDGVRQASQIAYDDAHYEGYRAGWRAAKVNSSRAFLFGGLFGIALSTSIWSFW